MAGKYLTKNMGTIDRGVRAFVIAPLAIVGAFVLGASSIGGIVLFVVAGIALVTGAIGSCPGYVPFGIDTRAGHVALPHRPALH
jgi:Inner membrane protein YgaP-like, transmembrane domain